jgi:hypothetical protein
MSTADGQTFARDLRDSQGRQLLKPSITVSKLKKVPRKVTSLEGLTSPLEPLGIRLSAGWAGVPPAEVCDEVANNIGDRLTAAALRSSEAAR